MSLIKVDWYVLRVKNIHSWSPPDPLGPRDKEKARYVHFDIRREEAKLRILKLASVFHHLPSVGPKQLCAVSVSTPRMYPRSGYFLVIDKVKNKNPSRKNGVTPLYIAAEYGEFEICKLLISNVERKNPPNKRGVTPLLLLPNLVHFDYMQVTC